ncbi:MAG: NAD-dependent histone deacetylase sir2 [Heterodermia speciosa]|uniref:NAD-dependent histone deacetylase sir2 n=1 Tax=Heterodermia speciosa TaxID=116794 RepID=A0A8H3G157_9LECA|nr:MAG: NAD-dependent histone deacetylase sir2 [Heterodermia speciosa]
MASADGMLGGSPLKAPAIEIVNLLSDAEDSANEPAPPTEQPQEDASSDDFRHEEWSMYEDALEGAVDDVSNDQILDVCTVEESLAFRKLLRAEGEDKFLAETVENGSITAKKLCTAFGIRPPAFLEGQSDEAYYNLLGLGICRELSKRVKLPQYNTIDDVVTLLQNSNNIIVLTGAGISTSLGIPDFRSKTTGLYSQLQHLGLSDPQEVFDISIFREDPTIFYSIAKDILPSTSTFSPTHAFIRLLQDRSKLLTNYTQNIDNIETHAGILPSKLIQCHGSFATATCLECAYQVPCSAIYTDLKSGRVARCDRCVQSLRQAKPTGGGIKRKRSYGGLPPKSHKKKREDYEDSTDEDEDYEVAVAGVMKPDITFFGEDLPDAFSQRLTLHDRDKVDLVLVIGTSLKVAPVSEVVGFLPRETPQVYISREACSHVDFDVDLLGDCDVVVAELCRRLGWELKHEMIPHESTISVELAQGYDSRYSIKAVI